MTEPFISRIGGVISADIAAPQHDKVLRFYSAVLSTGANPFWREDLFNAQGVAVIGVGAQAAEYAHLPIQWMPHIQVADVANSVKRAGEHGGRELMHGKDDAGNSQWAVLLDPNGVAFGVIPVVAESHLPSKTTSDDVSVGSIAWLDMTVVNADVTRDFYQQVVGWSVQDAAMEDADGSYADYNMLAADGIAAAGICHARGCNQDLPPVWMMYLPVGDLAESLRRVQELDGKIIKHTTGDDGEYTYAVIQDPVGAYMALVPG